MEGAVSETINPVSCPICRIFGALIFPVEEPCPTPGEHRVTAMVCPRCGCRAYWEPTRRGAIRKWNHLSDKKPQRLVELRAKHQKETEDGISATGLQML